MIAIAGSSDRQLSNGTFDLLQDTLIDVRGRVVDENGEPLSGVNIVVKGTKSGTSTNADGSFELKNINDNAVFEISSVGFETKKVNVTDKALFNTVLKKSTSQLDEVQIIAYGTTTKRLSTGNVSTVKAEDIEKQPVSNPLLALQGRVPGLYITQATGLPGSGVTVRIQGQNSIRIMVSDPLYVIDGVPY